MVEIQKINERELKVGKVRLFLSNDDIFYHISSGDLDEEHAASCCEQTLELLRFHEKEDAPFLIDLNKGGKTSYRARKILKEFTEKNVHGKLGLYGMHPVARILASFFQSMARKDNVRFFKTEADALEWIKESPA